jgi:hypothetical protein
MSCSERTTSQSGSHLPRKLLRNFALRPLKFKSEILIVVPAVAYIDASTVLRKAQTLSWKQRTNGRRDQESQASAVFC